MTDLPLPAGADARLLTSALLADVLDALGHRTSALPPFVRPLQNEWKFCGRAATLAAAPVACEPVHAYALEMEAIDALKPGEVLVAATNADRNSALWGELLSTAARARGAVGVVTDGLTRDAARILAMDFPVFAGGFSPLDSKGRLDGIHHGQPVRIGDCVIVPGDWVFADIDGVVVVPARLAEEAFARAFQKATGENRVRDELARGRSLREVFAEHGIL
jgi:4-hydroxy-4-methyl-2-oxoglutarate aldolase